MVNVGKYTSSMERLGSQKCATIALARPGKNLMPCHMRISKKMETSFLALPKMR